jgi:hypothetical protein
MEGAVVAAFTVRLIDLVLLPAELVAPTMKLASPVPVGVPLIMPEAEARLSPGGSVPLVTVQVIGAVPVAARV